MILDSVANARWENVEHTMVYCEATIEGNPNALPISVHNNETDDFRRDVWNAAQQQTIAEYVEEIADIADVRLTMKYLVDKKAGEARHRYITDAPGQEMTYQEKSEQAADFVAAGYPADTSNYPFIQAEIEATGKTKEQAADDILIQRSAWITVGAVIEKFRLSGKKQIDEASTAAEAQAIYDATTVLLDAV